jgi:hypothetical protein
MTAVPRKPAPGDSVTVRRWVQPSLEPGDPRRELAVEYSGVIGDMADGLILMGEAGGGFFCPDYVFLGGDPQAGTCAYLVTEIIPEAVAS